MFQNIKVDIIYYKSNTDFEMEFNLCGCCRMRLLTDKSPDCKTLVHSLARAVSRSRVIIITGSLFGDEGIINIAAEAINSKLTVADLKTYGISSDEDIEIIEGSTPLVTSEGYFGGCIIERGPQTMILLSDSKSIRKTIMQTLIHPYIEELCATELKEKAAASISPIITEEIADYAQAEVESEIITEDAEISDEEDAESYEESSPIVIDSSEPEEISTPAEDDIILSGGMIFETDDETYESDTPSPEEESDLFVESSKMRPHEAERYNAAYANYDYNDDGIIAEDDFRKTNNFSHHSLNLPIMIIAILLLIAVAVLCYCIFYIPSKDGISASAYIKEIFDTLFV